MRECDIKFFKDMLEERKKQILNNIESVQKELSEISEFDGGDEADVASRSTNSILEVALSKQQKKELEDIEDALLKIKNGSYGVCEMCEEPVGTQRLKVKPQAKYCITCREIAEKTK
ncbi:MAG: RNA polymerase-binding protein DksA [Campylobacterales bacterium]